MPSPHEPAICAAYAAFNARDVDAVLAFLTPDVVWANGMEGGFVHGHRAVREYWTWQWQQIDPRVEPLATTDLPDGRIDVEVRQVVKGLDGKLLSDRTVHHVYTVDGGKFARMEIAS